jgi:hypothetical protein
MQTGLSHVLSFILRYYQGNDGSKRTINFLCHNTRMLEYLVTGIYILKANDELLVVS